MAAGGHDLRVMTLTWRKQVLDAKRARANAGCVVYDRWLEAFLWSVFDALDRMESSRVRSPQMRPEDV